MINVKQVFLCASVTLQKWIGNKRIYAVIAIIFVFCFYTFLCLRQFAVASEIAVTAWVLPFFLSFPVMVIVFNCTAVLMFCNAPFLDNQTPFLVVRTGRLNYILGQHIYVIIAAFIFNVIITVASIVTLVPHVTFSSDWGHVINTLARIPGSALTYGIFMSVSIETSVIDYFTPIGAMFTSFVFMWLVNVFTGMIIMLFNIISGKLSGLIVAGSLIFFAYFSAYLGAISFGREILFLSPLSWSNIYNIDFTARGHGVPSPFYITTVLAVSIIVMSTASICLFCKKDMDYKEWRD